MRTFIALLVAMTALLALYGVTPGHAQNRGAIAAEIRQTHSLVLENLDLGDYTGARSQLENAIVKAEQAGLAEEMVNAKSHAMLAAIHVVGFRDDAGAIEHFKKTLAIAPGYQLEAPFDTERIKAVMARADAELNPVITCASLRGIDHKQVVQAKEGDAVTISFKAGPKLEGDTAYVHYRAQNGIKYAETALTRQGECDYTGQIPGAAITGELVYYFVSMRKDDGRFTAMRGNQKSPYPITVLRVAPKAQDLEAQTKREVPEELVFGSKKKPGGGCAGCASQDSGPRDLGWTLLVLACAAWLGRRRTRHS